MECVDYPGPSENRRLHPPDIAGLASRIAASGERMLGIELIPEVREFIGIGTQALVHEAVTRGHQAVAAVKARDFMK